MLSNRIILIFLGVIFLIIIILSSQKLSAGLKSRFSGLLPIVKPVPTVSIEQDLETTPTLTPTPTLSHFEATNTNQPTQKGGTPSQIPNTGASALSLGIITLMSGAGIILKRISKAN